MREEIKKCMCCNKEFVQRKKTEICDECWETKGKYGFYQCRCEGCWDTFWKPVKAARTTHCPDCRAFIKQTKAKLRKRKQREKDVTLSKNE